MKKIRNLIMALVIGMMLTSCSSQNTQGSKSIENTNIENVDSIKNNSEEIKEETMTISELEEALNNQPMKVINTEYLVQSDEYKSLYPDMLSAVIQNNSGTDVKNAIIGFVAWDGNNFPVKIEGSMDFNGGEYFKLVDCGDVNMINGATFGEGMGMELSENNKISKFKAIVVSYTDFDGESWNNPLLDDFKEIYVDKKLVE